MADTSASRPPQRVEYIDVARGLFVTWMLTAHALTLAHIPADHWMNHLRPAGWASVCFVMLTGFSLAVVHLGRPTFSEAFAKRLYQRSLWLIVIAYLSNLASEFITGAVKGTLTVAYLLDVARFRVPWTISGSLIPIAIVVALAPILLRAARRVHPVVLLLGVSIAGFLIDSNVAVPTPFDHNIQLSALAKATGPFNSSAFQLVLLSLWTFSVGSLTTRLRPSFRPWLLPAAAASTMFSLGLSAGDSRSTALFYDAGIFIVSMGIAGVLSSVPALGFAKRTLTLLGRAALFVFLFHRVLLQAAAAVLRLTLEQEALAFVLIVVGLTGCGSVALAKSRSERFRYVLARVGM